MATGTVRDHGVQPLDALMTRLGLSNTDLVRASTEQLTHKMIHKGRKGRQLTLNARKKILAALNTLRPGDPFHLSDLFTY